MSTAGQINEQTSQRRQKAAEGAANPHERAAKRNAYIRDCITEAVEQMTGIDAKREAIDLKMGELRAEKKSLNSQAKAIYDNLAVDDVDPKAFQDVYAQSKRTDEERVKYEASRRMCWSSMDLEQGETLDFVKLLETDVLEKPPVDEAERAQQIADHIGKHGTKAKKSH